MAYLGMALRLLRARDRVLDSLSRNAYGIYLVHYVFVLWLGYAFVGVTLNAPAKMILVCSAALVASWLTSAGASAIVAAVAKAPDKRLAKAPARPPTAIADQTR
jgi:peptidoglycan/LPS O-acetylase OafA/YrhL